MVKKVWALEILCIIVTITNVLPVLKIALSKNISEPFVAILDIGQGDSILLKTSTGKFGLIDTGKSMGVISQLEKFIPQYNKVLEFLLLTHPDSDHIGMFAEISKRYQINNLFINKTNKSNNIITQIKDIIIAKNIPNYSLFDNNDFKFENFTIDVLWPSSSIMASDLESNDYSISTLISVGSFDILTMGDLGSYIEDDLIDYLPNTDIEVLKLSHHGSKHSSSTFFLKNIAPKIALVSSGNNNSYGHPHKEVVQRLNDLGIPYLNTADKGNIVIKMENSGNYSII